MPDVSRRSNLIQTKVSESVELRALAEQLGGEVRGDPTFSVSSIRSLEQAGPSDLSIVARASVWKRARASAAGVLLIDEALAQRFEAKLDRHLLVVPDVGAAFAQAIDLFHPPPELRSGIDDSARISDSAEVDETVSVGAYAVVGAGTRIEARTTIAPHVVIGKDCVIGSDSVLHPHVVVYDRTIIGERCSIHAGVVLGADGFGYASTSSGHRKIPQVGRTVIGDDVEIGANSAVDCATLEETRIGAGTKIDNLVQVGHNVSVGEHCLLCGQAGVAGSARLGKGVLLAGQSGAAGHIELGDGVQVAGKSAAFSSVEAGKQVAGIPAVEVSLWRRMQAAQRRLTTFGARLMRLERSVEESAAARSSRSIGEEEVTE